MRMTVLRGLVAASLLVGSSLAARAEPVKILFNTFIGHSHLWNAEVLFPWFEEVTKATEGRVTFEVPTASLAAPPAQYESVVKGVFDAGYINNAFLANVAKLPQMAILPLVTYSSEGNSRAMLQTYKKYFEKADEYKDVHLLALYVGLGGDMLGKKPISSVADLKGLKIFAMPGATATLLDDAGAAVVAAPAVRAYEIISSGTVDAFAGISLFDFILFNTLQYAKNVTLIPGGTTASTFSVFMSKSKWGEISAQDQATITRLAEESLIRNFSANDRRVAGSIEDAKKAGLEVQTASPAFLAELAALAKTQEDAWIATADAMGVPGREALEFYRAQAIAETKEIAARGN